MKTHIQLLVVTVAILLLHAFSLQGQSFKLRSYDITVQGTSTLHEWESTIEKAEVKGSYIVEKNSLTDVKDIVVKIPVTSIKSTKGKTMDNKTYEAFNYEKHPFIVFTITKSEINEEKATINTKGILTMAGVSKAIDLTAGYKLLPNGELKITGSRKLLMSDFKMVPPTAMMGTIKVGNEVVITFDLTLTTSNTIL